MRCAISRVEVEGDSLPFTITSLAVPEGGAVTVDASGSSQFVSGLLLSGARFEKGITVKHEGGPLPSLPHIEMTCAMLREAGCRGRRRPEQMDGSPRANRGARLAHRA